MSDLIRREDVNDLIKQICDACGEGEKYNGVMCRCCRFDDFIGVVDNIPSAEPERISMVWKPAKGRPAYEKGICNCGYVLSVLQRDFVYCPMCGAKLEWSE